MNENDSNVSSIRTFPNPTSRVFSVKNVATDYTLEIFNSAGEKVLSGQRAAGNEQIDLGSQPAGVYFVRITSGNKVTTEKVVKE